MGYTELFAKGNSYADYQYNLYLKTIILNYPYLD